MKTTIRIKSLFIACINGFGKSQSYILPLPIQLKDYRDTLENLLFAFKQKHNRN